MKYEQLSPGKFWHTNGILQGRENIPDLFVTRYSQGEEETITASSYRLSLLQRLKFLFCGRLHVCVFGLTHAPIAVGVGELFKKPEDNCLTLPGSK